MAIKIKTVFSAWFTLLCVNFLEICGGYDKLLKVLIFFIVIDYLTGIAKAIKGRKLNSYIGFKGIAKKVGIFCVVVMAHQLDVILVAEDPVMRSLAIAFYISNEGISIFENLTELEVPFPEQIKNVLLNFKKEV